MKDLGVSFRLLGPTPFDPREPVSLLATAKTADGSVGTLYQFTRKRIVNPYAPTKQGFTGLVAIDSNSGPSIQYICQAPHG